MEKGNHTQWRLLGGGRNYLKITPNPVKMIDVSNKNSVHREAEAKGKIYLRKNTIEAIKNKNT